MEGERQVLAEPSTSFTGSCGGAVIRVMGVTSTVGNQFGIDSDAAVVIVRQAGKELSLRDMLSDHNAVACVTTSTGDKLLIGSACGGSACPDSFSFVVVDPKRVQTLAPRKPTESCDERCAEKALGAKIPASMRK